MVSQWITTTAAKVEEGCSRDLRPPAVMESMPLVIGLPLSRIVWWLSVHLSPHIKIIHAQVSSCKVLLHMHTPFQALWRLESGDGSRTEMSGKLHAHPS